jgi:hypothetical protein
MNAMNASSDRVSMREAVSEIAYGLSDLARAADELQRLMCSLVWEAGAANDPATLEQAQVIDMITQRLHRYAASVAELAPHAPLDISVPRQNAVEPVISSPPGECEMF